MTKKQAIGLFGTTLADLGLAIGGRGKSAISQWPDLLTDDQINMVLGAALRRGINVPKELINKPSTF